MEPNGGLREGSEFAVEFGPELGFGGKVKLITTGEDAFLLIRAERVFDDRVVFVGTKNEAESRLVTKGPTFTIVIIDVELELAKILVGEFANLEV